MKNEEIKEEIAKLVDMASYSLIHIEHRNDITVNEKQEAINEVLKVGKNLLKKLKNQK